MESIRSALPEDEALDLLRKYPALFITPEGDPILLTPSEHPASREYTMLAVLARALIDDAPELSDLVDRYVAQFRAEYIPPGETIQ